MPLALTWPSRTLQCIKKRRKILHSPPSKFEQLPLEVLHDMATFMGPDLKACFILCNKHPLNVVGDQSWLTCRVNTRNGEADSQ